MQVRVRPMGALRHALPGAPRELWVELPDGATVADLKAHLRLPDHLVWYANINGEVATLESPIGDGAEVIFFAPVTGG